MRVFIDTNVLFSASLFPSGTVARAYEAAVSAPNHAIVSDYVIDELRSVYARKFPSKTASLDVFLASMASAVEIVLTPDDGYEEEGAVRDPADRPVLRAAKAAGAEVLLTGDKDLLESGVEPPRIVTPREFLGL